LEERKTRRGRGAGPAGYWSEDVCVCCDEEKEKKKKGKGRDGGFYIDQKRNWIGLNRVVCVPGGRGLIER
jgi:hypothetical protein